MSFQRLAVAGLIAILAACQQIEPPVQPEDRQSGKIEKARVTGALDNVAVGEPVSLRAAYDASGVVDPEAVKYSWSLYQGDGPAIPISAEELAKWVPKEPGTYQFTVEITYGEKTVTATVILVVVEKPHPVDFDLSARLKAYREHLPGHYVGDVRTPWAAPYKVAFEFRDDGSYRAYNAESDRMPALYYGTDSDGPEKTWVLNDMRADGTAKGKLTVLFHVGTTTVDALEDLRFEEDYGKLSFSMVHLGNYGPVELSLSRVDASEMPPLPLATPSMEFESQMPMGGAVDPVTVRFAAPAGLTVLYQILPMEGTPPDLMNPNPLWRTGDAQVATGPITIQPQGRDVLLLVRASDGMRMGGVLAQTIWFAK